MHEYCRNLPNVTVFPRLLSQEFQRQKPLEGQQVLPFNLYKTFAQLLGQDDSKWDS
jgi:hypothetical protein